MFTHSTGRILNIIYTLYLNIKRSIDKLFRLNVSIIYVHVYIMSLSIQTSNSNLPGLCTV